MAATTLSPERSSALLDILSHHEVYAEIRDFRSPESLTHYGPPFRKEKGRLSTSPSLQALVSRFLLNLPGLRDVSNSFWQDECHAIIKDLEKADLSESYDKGNLGIRKTLATAISVLIEYPVRGLFGGLEKPPEDEAEHQYDATNPQDLAKAFRDFIHQAVYGSVLEDLFKKAAETDKLSEHPKIVQATHEYVLVK